jgi:hypothetical protein
MHRWDHVILPVTFHQGSLQKGLGATDARQIAALGEEGFELVAATSTAYEKFTLFFKRERPTLEAESIPSSSDTADLISNLAELRDAGVISSADFESKKAELMERI